MIRFLLRLTLLVIAVLGASEYIPQIHLEDVSSAILLVILLLILNVTVKPVLILFTIPITLITLGLFLLVINTLIVLIADGLLEGFYVEGFWWAFVFALLLSFFNYLIDNLLDKDKNKNG